jgi:formylglycine-generating enzyme required for sulfatase activity
LALDPESRLKDAREFVDRLRRCMGESAATVIAEPAATESVSKTPEVGERGATERVVSSPGGRDVPGFSYLRDEAFSLGGQRHTVKIYRCERFAKALRLNAGQTEPACEFVLIPAGDFTMGSPDSEAERNENEGPRHPVSVKRFLMARTELTQGVWEGIMRKNPAKFKGAKRPVEQVTWGEAVKFCKKTGLRLPSEAEWEYSCRAGTTGPYAYGATVTTEQVNYSGNYPYGDAPMGLDREKTTDVDSFAANAFGLLNMHGNVLEWCQDAWHDSYQGAPNDGTAWGAAWSFTRSERVYRGGGWLFPARLCRSASRGSDKSGERYTSLGFRPAASLPK